MDRIINHGKWFVADIPIEGATKGYAPTALEVNIGVQCGPLN